MSEEKDWAHLKAEEVLREMDRSYVIPRARAQCIAKALREARNPPRHKMPCGAFGFVFPPADTNT